MVGRVPLAMGICHAMKDRADSISSSDGQTAAIDPDRRWLDALVRRYTPALHRFFERRLDRQADVHDLVQDVFLRLSRMDGAHTIEKPENYLFTTASNALRDHIRCQTVRQSHRHDPIHEAQSGTLPSCDVSPLQIVEGRQAIHALQRALHDLPERTRDIFVLRMIEGQRTVDVAQVIGISTRAVEKHYATALARVAGALRAYRD